MFKKALKCIAAVLCLLICAAAVLIIYLTVNEYSPEDTVVLDIVNTGSVEEAETGTIIKVLTWNTGYSALGKDADFFMDGGKSVQSTDEETVQKNLSAISDIIDAVAPDICLLQEVDINSKRTYGINEFEALCKGDSAYALNYSCSFVPFPLPPIGKVNSGIMTSSVYSIAEAERIALPCPFKWPISTANLKRCLLKSCIPIKDSDKQLVVINLHLEAYDDGTGKVRQAEMLKTVMEEEYAKGNYVIAGGDFNQTFPGSLDVFPIVNSDHWVPGVLESSALSEGWVYAYDTTSPTCRLLNEPYSVSGKNAQFYVIDGFIISPNISLESIENIDGNFEYSDHNPVLLQVILN